MPTYEYACKSCGEHLEVVQSFRDDPLTECPNCGGTLRKVFSPVGIAFKGSGFYKTDSRSTSPKKSSEKSDSSSSPEKTSSSSSDAASTSKSDSGSSSGSGSGSGSGSSSGSGSGSKTEAKAS